MVLRHEEGKGPIFLRDPRTRGEAYVPANFAQRCIVLRSGFGDLTALSLRVEPEIAHYIPLRNEKHYKVR